MSVNQVHLLGRCGQDPEIRTVGQNNVSRATFSLCTGGKYKTHDGREVDDTAWQILLSSISEREVSCSSSVICPTASTRTSTVWRNGLLKS